MMTQERCLYGNQLIHFVLQRLLGIDLFRVTLRSMRQFLFSPINQIFKKLTDEQTS